MALAWPFASNLFGFTQGPLGYLIPKPKFLFYVDFVINQTYQLNPTNWTRLGYIVKSVDRPKFKYMTTEADQYNRKRLFYTKVKYEPISIVLRDTVDSVVQQMIDDNNRFNFGDFNNMISGDGSQTYSNYWANNAIAGNDTAAWGYQLKNTSQLLGVNLPSGGANYFSEVRIYEFYGNNFTQYSLMNPKIIDVNYAPGDQDSSDGQEVTMVIDPEGVVMNYIDAPIEISALAQSFMPGPGFTTGTFPIATDLISTITALIGNISRAGGGLLSGVVNGIFGSFGSINNTPGIASAVGIIGGSTVAAVLHNVLGPSISNSVPSTSVLLSDSFASSSILPQNPISSTNTLQGISTISGSGSDSVSLGVADDYNLEGDIDGLGDDDEDILDMI